MQIGVVAKRIGLRVDAILLRTKRAAFREHQGRTLDGWPGVFSDDERRIVGYWGLAIPAVYRSPHTLKISGRTLADCRWRGHDWF